jgi:cytochrome c-type biogenesis protein CcmH/NrfG
MGNTYAKLQKIDEAIDSYKAALKLKHNVQKIQQSCLYIH